MAIVIIVSYIRINGIIIIGENFSYKFFMCKFFVDSFIYCLGVPSVKMFEQYTVYMGVNGKRTL